MARSEERGAVQHERARRAVFGFLGSAILHETNNVLTVMAGVRQLLKAGIALSDRVGTKASDHQPLFVEMRFNSAK